MVRSLTLMDTHNYGTHKKFLLNREKIIEFVDNVFQNIVNEKDELSPELKKYQRNFTTDPFRTYPTSQVINMTLQTFQKQKTN